MSGKPTLALVLFTLAVGPVGPANAADSEHTHGSKPRLAVLGFSAPDLDEQLRLALADIVSVEAEAASAMEVATASDTRAFLTLAQQKQLLGCSEEQCLGQFAGVVDAQRLVSGSINRVSDQYLVALQLIDVVNGRVIQRVSEQCAATPDALVATTRKLVPGLFGVVSKIVLWNQPVQSTVYLDGRLVGRTPVGVVPVRTGGKHRLEVVGPAVTPWRTSVDVAPGAELRLRAQNRSFVDLEAEAHTRRVWGYSLLGGGVAALALGGALYAGALHSDARLDSMDLRLATSRQLDAVTGTTTAYFIGAVAAAIVGAAASSLGAYYLGNNPAEAQLAAGGAL